MHLESLKKIRNDAQNELKKISNINDLENFRIKYTGRKSILTKILRSIKDLPDNQKKSVGLKANELKNFLEEQIKKLREKIQVSETQTNEIDITAPGVKRRIGSIHPITQERWYIEDIFQKMGFQVFEAFDIDDDYHTFESLNIPVGHPARNMWDTFWTEDGFIPIPHTSAMQNRILKAVKPPVRAVIIGNCFRNERTDPRHEHTLMQCEGLYVDRGITLSNMIGTLKSFFTQYFEKETEVKVTPAYFPFVEPGNEMSLSCFLCNKKGCRLCKGTGWLEILGCGMIHPNVLREGGINPDVYSGFAWGFGLDRLVQLKHKIEDVRHFHSGDLRFIQQF